MKIFKIACLLIGLSIISCTNSKESVNNQEQNDSITTENKDSIIDKEHNAKNSLDWEGTYHGVIPCADCEGIHLMLTLKGDDSYNLMEEYQGTDVKNDYKGDLIWSLDGNKINFKTTNGNYIFFVGENKLTMLDQEGKPIEGQLADKYILVKK